MTRLALASVAIAAAVVPAGAADPAPFDVYVLAGQSNMSGRGSLTDLTAAERVADPRIRLYANDGTVKPALDPLDDATGQVDPISADRQAAVGPGLFFARALAARGGPPILLVPCAKGGTSIGRWKPGGDRTTLYGSCIARVRAAGGNVAGILWYQGESDAEKAPESAARWTAAFATLAAAFRSDLGNKRLPIAVVSLADRPAQDPARYQSWASVQEQQARLKTPCTQTVSAAGLPRNPDDLHLTTAAQRELGPRLAQAIDALHRRGCR